MITTKHESEFIRGFTQTATIRHEQKCVFEVKNTINDEIIRDNE